MWWRALLVGGFLAVLVGACAVVDPVDQRYDTVTRSLSKARNEAIFLNLIRASHDYPLSFTTIANVTPTMTNTTALGLPTFLEGPGSIFIAKGATSPTSTFPTTSPFRDFLFGSTTASNSTAVGTNFNVATQETGNFYEGFLKPIDLTILDYFIRQGYPREMLFWLFTDSFELDLPGKPPLGFHYSPPDDLGCDPYDQKHRCFTDWVHNATLSGLTVEEKTQERPSTSARGGGHGGGSTDTNPASKPTTYTYARFCFSSVLAEQAQAAVHPKSLILQSRNDSDVTKEEVYGGDLRCGAPTWHPEQTATEPQEDILPLEFKHHTIKFRIIPRSAYGVFEFLGLLMKLQREGYKPPPNALRPWVADMPPLLATVGNEPLIDVVQDQNYNGRCFVHSWFNDGDYCVPDNATTTKRIFGLLAQLIAIQTAASDLSITPIVRVIQ